MNEGRATVEGAGQVKGLRRKGVTGEGSVGTGTETAAAAAASSSSGIAELAESGSAAAHAAHPDLVGRSRRLRSWPRSASGAAPAVDDEAVNDEGAAAAEMEAAAAGCIAERPGLAPSWPANTCSAASSPANPRPASHPCYTCASPPRAFCQACRASPLLPSRGTSRGTTAAARCICRSPVCSWPTGGHRR